MQDSPYIGQNKKLVDAVTLALKSMDATGANEAYPIASGNNEDATHEHPRPRSGDHLKRKGAAAFSRVGSFAATDDTMLHFAGAGSIEAAALHSELPQSHAEDAHASTLSPKNKRVCKGEASGMPPKPPMDRSNSAASSKADLFHYTQQSSGMTAPPVQTMVGAGTSSGAPRGGGAPALQLHAEGPGHSRFRPTNACLPNTMRRNDSMASEASVHGTCATALACTESALFEESPVTATMATEAAMEQEPPPSLEVLPLSPVRDYSDDDESEEFLSCFGDETESPRSMVDATHSSLRSAGDKQSAEFVLRYGPLLTAMLPGSRPIPREALIFDLEIANRAIAGEALPDGIVFTPLDSCCCLLPMAAQCGIPPIAVVLGASYLQRLMVSRPEMRAVADEAGWFVPGHDGGVERMRPAPFNRCTLGLLTIYVTCIYVAAKLADRVQYRSLLSTMLSGLLGQQVPAGEATALERQVLEKLEWRLGPFYV